MLITAKKQIPFSWIVLATLPWVAVIFKDKVMGIAFTFSMRKFVENPAALTFLLTVPLYISWIVPPVVNFVADRIWTRWGRRKPFIFVSWIGTIVTMGLMPLSPDFGTLLAAYIAFCVFNDLGTPVESLKMEIVPPAQRATSAAVMSWIGQVAVLVFWVVAIGRFNEMNSMFGLGISGEQALYWTVSIGMIVMILFLTLGIRETNPHSALRGEKFSFRTVFKGLFHPQLWRVYILAFSVAILGTGLGALNLLLVTEQWGYTQQELGTNIFVGGIVNLFLIPLLGLLANRVGRGSVYVGLVIAGIVVNLAMYLYYNFVLYDARPTLIEMIVFGEMLSVIGILTGMALTPFVYDFIPRNELGTYAAGSGLVQRGTNILTASLMGLFVTGYASLFLGPPGEMVRVSLSSSANKAEVQALLKNAAWTDPASGAAIQGPKVTVQAWYATGAVLDHGRGFEIRLGDDGSADIRKQRDRLEDERGKYRARRGYAQTSLRRLVGPQAAPTTGRATGPATSPAAQPGTGPSTQSDEVQVADVEKFADDLIEKAKEATRRGHEQIDQTSNEEGRLAAMARAEGAGEDLLDEGISRLDGILNRRAARFMEQVRNVLGGRIARDGEQIIGASIRPAVVLHFPLGGRPEGEAVEKTLDRLHKTEPAVVDLRVITDDGNLMLALSGSINSDDADAVTRRLTAALAAQAVEGLRSSMTWPPAPSAANKAEALNLDLRIIEDPLDGHPSPITRGVHGVMSIVADPPTPERRLNALGRTLRISDLIEHASATLVPGQENAIRVTAVVGVVDQGYTIRTSCDKAEELAAGHRVRMSGIDIGKVTAVQREASGAVAAIIRVRPEVRIAVQSKPVVKKTVTDAPMLVIEVPENATAVTCATDGTAKLPYDGPPATPVAKPKKAKPPTFENKLEDLTKPVVARLGEMSGAQGAEVLGALYAKIVPAAKEQRMTVARPVLTVAFAKQQYDYLAGYIAIFILQLVGLCIVFYFLYLVRKGKVRRRGAEEAEAIR